MHQLVIQERKTNSYFCPQLSQLTKLNQAKLYTHNYVAYSCSCEVWPHIFPFLLLLLSGGISHSSFWVVLLLFSRLFIWTAQTVSNQVLWSGSVIDAELDIQRRCLTQLTILCSVHGLVPRHCSRCRLWALLSSNGILEWTFGNS